jgi:hypothetical protein
MGMQGPVPGGLLLAVCCVLQQQSNNAQRTGTGDMRALGTKARFWRRSRSRSRWPRGGTWHRCFSPSPGALSVGRAEWTGRRLASFPGRCSFPSAKGAYFWFWSKEIISSPRSALVCQNKVLAWVLNESTYEKGYGGLDLPPPAS